MPSRPAPSNWLNQPAATFLSLVAGVRYTGGAAFASASSSSARRRSNGSPVQSSSPIASRSNATNEAGVCSASSRTRLAAGWIRCSSASKCSRLRSVSGTTISPSMTDRSGRFARTAVTSSGK